MRIAVAGAATGALLLLGAVLRLGGLSHMEWKGEERFLCETACRIAAGGPLPLDGGPTSVGLRMPPGFPWLLAALWRLAPSPPSVAFALAMLNVAALGRPA